MERPVSRPIAGHGLLERGELVGRQLDPAEHGEQGLFVVIVHLDLGDIGPLRR